MIRERVKDEDVRWDLIMRVEAVTPTGIRMMVGGSDDKMNNH
jgi:hypothetical protein